MGIKDIIKPIGSRSFVIGIGVSALAYFIGPQLKQALKPVAVKGVQGIMTLSSKSIKAFGENKEKLSHMLVEKAEEPPNISKKPTEVLGLQETFIKELKEERETSNRILQELANSISGLKDELIQMRNNDSLQ